MVISKSLRLSSLILLGVLLSGSFLLPHPAQAALNGTSCPSASLDFAKASYAPGEKVVLNGSNPTGKWSLCLYNKDGNPVASTLNAQQTSLSYQSAATDSGTLTGVIRLEGQCSPQLSNAGNCRKTATLTASSNSNNSNSGNSNSSTTSTTAAPTADAPAASIADPECDTNSWKYCNPLRHTIENLTEFGTKSVQSLLGLIGTIALLFLVIAGATYMTAAGDEEKIKNAKRIITGTIIGLAIALVSFSLLRAILDMLNNS